MSLLRILKVLVLGPVMLGCSTPKKQEVINPLPKRWTAQLVTPRPGLNCQTQHTLNSTYSFQLCSSKKAHGLVRFYKKQAIISEFQILSRDPLALSASITEDSAWSASEKNLYVGTMDGRILKFNFQGEHLGEHLLEMPTWVQHLKWSEDHLYVVGSRHESVRILKLNDKLLPQRSFSLKYKESEAFLTYSHKALFLSTHKGSVYHLDSDLGLLHEWSLGEHLELSKVLVLKEGIWLGDSEGVLYKITPERLKRVKLGQGPISSAPIKTQHGVWIAFDEEGILRLIGKNFKVEREIKLPITRSFTGFESLSFQGHTLLRTSTQGIVTLLNSQGEILSSAEGEEGQVEFTPETEDALAQERLPASLN